MDQNKQDRERFKQLIAQIESSGGKNFKHKQLQNGIHSGDSAIGRYGLMPNTVQETLTRGSVNDTLDPELEPLRGMDSGQLKELLEYHPDLEEKVINPFMDRNLERAGGDMDKAAYMHNMGHNLDPRDITPDKLTNHPYIQKFRKLKERLKGYSYGRRAK